MNEGWIRVSRRLLDHPLWTSKPFTPGQAWVDLLLQANYRDGAVWRGSREVIVLRGQVFTSQLALAKRWRWDRKTVRRLLDGLKSSRMVDIETAKGKDIGYTRLTVRNYERFQAGTETERDIGRDIDTDTQGDSDALSERTLGPHIQEVQEGKKGRSKPSSALSAPGRLIALYISLFEARYGQSPNVTRGKDGRLFKDLIAQHGESTVASCLRAFLEHEGDDFVRSSGHSLGAFKARFNALKVGRVGSHARPGNAAAWDGKELGEVKL